MSEKQQHLTVKEFPSPRIGLKNKEKQHQNLTLKVFPSPRIGLKKTRKKTTTESDCYSVS